MWYSIRDRDSESRLRIFRINETICMHTPGSNDLIFQTIQTHQGYALLLKSLFFYIAITLEAFIFCFAGEHLSNKV